MSNLDPYTILMHPLSTEKAVREMEANNTLLFAVAKDATKGKIRWAIQKEFGVKVMKVRTVVSPKGDKKAYIKLHPDTPAIDVTSKLGIV